MPRRELRTHDALIDEALVLELPREAVVPVGRVLRPGGHVKRRIEPAALVLGREGCMHVRPREPALWAYL